MSLGGKSTTSNTIDPDLKAAALANLEMARRVGQLGYVPYKEATVAGLQPSQIAAMGNTNMGAEAFGLTQAAAPVAGDLSPYGMYQTALANMSPGQRAFINSMFINPITGAAPKLQFNVQPVATTSTGKGGSSSSSSNGYTSSGSSGGSGNLASSQLASRLPGGVNTANPASAFNEYIARITQPASSPLSAARPVARPVSITPSYLGGR